MKTGVSSSVAVGQKTASSGARWVIIAPLLLFFSLMAQIDKTNISVVIADHKFLADMGMLGQPGHVGLLNGLFLGGYGAGMLVWGFIIDRFGARRSAMFSVCAWSVGTLGCAWAANMPELYCARAFLGLAEGCIWPLSNTYTGRWFPAREHSRFTGLWISGAFIGIAVGIPIATGILLMGGWRFVFVALGLFSLLLVPLFYFFGADSPAASRYANQLEVDLITKGAAQVLPGTEEKGERTLLKSLFNVPVLLLMLCHASSAGTLWGLTTWLPTYLVRERGMTMARMSGVLSLNYIFPIAVVLLVGYLTDKAMQRALQRTWIGAAVAIGTICILIAAISVPWVHVTAFLLVLAIAAPMIYGGLHSALLHEYVPKHQIGRCTGFVMGLGNMLGSLAPVVMGYLVGMFGGKFLVAFMLIVGLNVLSLVMYAMLGLRTRAVLKTV